MTKDDPRKAYWNEKYVQYWRSRVEEAGAGESSIVKGDARTEDDEIYERIFSDTPFNAGNILDVGCAWGRMFPIYMRQNLRVSGVDISAEMIKAANEKWSMHEKVDSLGESSAEQLPFEEESFDNLVCLATFDATYQHHAMTEFLRVSRPGALLYLTGKNTNYYLDDEAAFAAEVGARSKGHPNYFTRVHELVEELEGQGHKLIKSYYFPRRGDFASFVHKTEPPDKFYEYLIIFRRGKDYTPISICSDEYSKTFKKLSTLG